MLTLILTILNTCLLIIMSFWLVNKDCRECKQEKPLSKIFKTFCPTCEEVKDE